MIEGSWKRRSVTQSLTRQGPMARRIIESLRRLIGHGTSCNQDSKIQLRINRFATTPFLSSLRDKGCRSFSPTIDFPRQLPRDLMQIINIQSMLEHRFLHQDYQGKSIGHICCTCWGIGPCTRATREDIGPLPCLCWSMGPCDRATRDRASAIYPARAGGLAPVSKLSGTTAEGRRAKGCQSCRHWWRCGRCGRR